MLETYAHNQLKLLQQKDALSWPHNLTLSRLISRSLRRQDKSLIQIEIADQDCYWLGVLIPLCFYSKGVVLVLTERQRRRLLAVEMRKLNQEGLFFPCWDSPKSPPEGHVWLLNHQDFYHSYRNGALKSKQIIFLDAERMSDYLRSSMALKVSSWHWDSLRRAHPAADSSLIKLHQKLSRRLFSQASSVDAQVRLDFNEIFALRDLLNLLTPSPAPWPQVLETSSESWASWAELDHKTLDWTWHLQPIEPLKILQQMFIDNPFVMIAGSTQKHLFFSELESLVGKLQVNVTLGGPIRQEPINLFVPRRQPLPNTEYFSEYLLDQCRRLILGRMGLTIVLLDDEQLLKQLTSALAAEFGKRITYQSTSPESNGVICASSSWWLEFQDQLPSPEQLIIAILPFPSLRSPLISFTVESLRMQGLDWFRDFLLPELLSVLPRLVLPIRHERGRLAILDGRLRSRSWGKKIFTVLEPWVPLDRLLPD